MGLKQLERKGLQAVKTLRRSKLNSGVPFMIFVPTLPLGHFLLEFPGGTFKEATIDKRIYDYVITRELSFDEVQQFRTKYKLD